MQRERKARRGGIVSNRCAVMPMSVFKTVGSWFCLCAAFMKRGHIDLYCPLWWQSTCLRIRKGNWDTEFLEIQWHYVILLLGTEHCIPSVKQRNLSPNTGILVGPKQLSVWQNMFAFYFPHLQYQTTVFIHNIFMKQLKFSKKPQCCSSTC